MTSSRLRYNLWSSGSSGLSAYERDFPSGWLEHDRLHGSDCRKTQAGLVASDRDRIDGKPIRGRQLRFYKRKYSSGNGQGNIRNVQRELRLSHPRKTTTTAQILNVQLLRLKIASVAHADR